MQIRKDPGFLADPDPNFKRQDPFFAFIFLSQKVRYPKSSSLKLK